jgi:hypothetical protein
MLSRTPGPWFLFSTGCKAATLLAKSIYANIITFGQLYKLLLSCAIVPLSALDVRISAAPRRLWLQQRYSRLGYVALNVSDVERSAQFYEKLWGFTRTARMLPETASPPSGSIFLYVLDPGG